TLVPLVVPQDMRGRVLAVENVFIGGSNELGAFESGVAGQALGPAGAIVLGVTRNYAVAFAAMLVLSGADAISVFIRATLVPLVVPQEMRGRVLAVENVFIGGSNELGAFESGVAGQILGPAGAVVLGGAATVAIAGTWAFAFPALRDIDRFPGSAQPVERDVIILDELGP
ncbi:MAG: hypothetical protein ABW008_08670, partial [Acidimicrobiales bacterium]